MLEKKAVVVATEKDRAAQQGERHAHAVSVVQEGRRDFFASNGETKAFRKRVAPPPPPRANREEKGEGHRGALQGPQRVLGSQDAMSLWALEFLGVKR